MTNTLNLKFKTEDGKGKVFAITDPDMDLNKETVDAAMTAIQESKILETKGTVIVGIAKAEYVQTVTTPVA